MVSTSSSSRVAVRWAAVGAALAVALGGGFGIARATAPSGAAAFVPVTPCRLFDTRPDFAVGPRTSPLGPEETFTIVATGRQGDCDLPESATGVVLNVTAVDATAATFLTVWPAGSDQPNASSVNPTPGAPPTPNAVTTGLGADHAFSVFNQFGTVHVLADVVGYYTDHRHDDRYYTRAEVDALLATRTTDPEPEAAFVPQVHIATYTNQFSWAGAPGTAGLSAGLAGPIATFEKLRDDTVIEVIWSSQGMNRGGGMCSWSIRIDGQPDRVVSYGLRPSDAIHDSTAVVPLKVIDVFAGLASGTHTVELWARGTATANCLENVGVFRPQVIVKEYPADVVGP